MGMTPAFWRLGFLTCQHERPTLAAQLAECSRQLWASEQRRARAEGQLDHYIGQAIRARAERDRAEREHRDSCALLAQAIDEQDTLADRVDALERALTEAERAHEELVGMADRFRTELRELRAGIAVGALHRKGTR